MKLRRFSDIPLVLKVGFAPAFALLMLAAVAVGTLWSQQQQTVVLAGVVGNDALQTQLAADAQDITAANGALYELMTKQAAGGSVVNSQAALTKVLSKIDAVSANLVTLRPGLSPAQQSSFDGVLNDLADYRGGIEVVGSMLGVDFNTAAAFIQPFERNYTRMTVTLNNASREVAQTSMRSARHSTSEAALAGKLMLLLVGSTLLAVTMVSWIIVLAVRHTVADISQATEGVANGDSDLDLARLARRDEFGAIVRSLTIFRNNQLRITAMHHEQEAMEARQEIFRQDKERLIRMISVLSETNEAILRAETREKLFQLVCEAAAVGGKFTFTNVVVRVPGTEFLQVAAAAGPSALISMTARPSASNGFPPERELAETAFSTKQPCISNDYLMERSNSSFFAMVRSTGTRSGAALPLLSRGEVVGCLLLMADQQNTFSPEFVELLQRLASNVSFALENFNRAEEREQAEERIKYLASHDSLTDLPNRAMFNQLLSFSIKTATRYDRQCAVLFIDLDRFKLINDSLGHAAGDALLIEMAIRLRSIVRASDVVARLGGDEFVILLNEINGSEEAAAVAHTLLTTFSHPLELNGHECRITASVGIAMFPDHGTDEQTLMKNADIAMYLAKAEGKNDVRFFSNEIRTQSIDRLKIETSLQHAVERDELYLDYQPKLDVTTGKIAGVEALLRWNHPELGLLSPVQFIPLAEETGLIIVIGRWVLRTACAQHMAWQRAGFPPMSMAVNVSPRQFSDEHLLGDIDDALAVSGMHPNFLQIEITESMVMLNVERAIRVLEEIQRRGVRLAIDDFGTGYSSMSLLKRFPVDTIKIDRPSYVTCRRTPKTRRSPRPSSIWARH